MANCQVFFKSSAEKEPDKLNNAVIVSKITNKIDMLVANPYTGAKKLKGSENRIKISNYKVVYEIDEQKKLIRILRIRHKKRCIQEFINGVV